MTHKQQWRNRTFT